MNVNGIFETSEAMRRAARTLAPVVFGLLALVVADCGGGGSSGSGAQATARPLLYFSADDGIHGAELWVTDGTAGGTALVKDVFPGAGASNPAEGGYTLPRPMTVSDNQLFFAARNDIFNYELWKTDGTGAGTVLVKDFSGGFNSSLPGEFVSFGGSLYFSNSSGVWHTDGTDAGTVLVTDQSLGWRRPIIMGDAIFFSAVGAFESQLWKADRFGAFQVKDIRLSTNIANPSGFAVFRGALYFAAQDNFATSLELWKSDGTGAGTTLVKDINPNVQEPPFISNLVVFNDALYFSASDGAHGLELWKSDGTELGTMMVKDINLVPDPAFGGFRTSSSSPTSLTVFNGALYFFAGDQNGYSLWKTDGTDTGTVVVKQPGLVNPLFTSLTVANNWLYFAGDDGVHGLELWRTDGTDAGTTMVADIFPGSQGSSPDKLTAYKDLLLFTADDGVAGRELWKSDGTAAGTVLVKDINPGPAASNALGFMLF